MNQENNGNYSFDANGQSFSLKDSLLKYAHYWWLFLLVLILGVTGSWLYLRYTPPQFTVSASLLIRNESSTLGGGGTGDNVFADIALFKANTDKLSEIEILKSRTMMERVVRSLGLSLSYFVTGKVKITNIYRDAPFEFQLLYPSDTNAVFRQQFHFSNDFKQFTVGDSATTYNMGETIRSSFGSYRIIEKTSHFSSTEFRDFEVVYMPAALAALEYGSALEVKPANESSNVLQITYLTGNPRLGADIVNQLMFSYNDAAIEDKNEINRKIIKFISDRLALVESQLDSVERDMQLFKTHSNIVDLNAQAQLYLGNISEVDRTIQEQEIQLQVVDLLSEYLTNPANRNTLVPTTLGLKDPTLLAFVQSYNELVGERTGQLQTGATSGSQIVQNIDNNIETARVKMLQNLSSIRQSFASGIQKLQNKNGNLQRQITSIPEKERMSREKARQQEIKQSLYLYLLQKKEESSIAEASTISSSRVVDKALPSGIVVSPKTSRIYGLALIIGLFLPVAIIYILDLLNDKVTTRNDITKATAAPIIGEIGHSDGEEMLVFPGNSRSVIAEQFRIIRSNLNYLVGDNSKKPVIMVTSSFSGEGKSFVSTNLAAALALSGKKTVVLEFDLRKPKILVGLGIPKGQGLTNYLVGGAQLNELAHEVPNVENLYVIGSGPVPPNPSEILLTDRINDLFTWLIKNFDAVVIDTAPIGLVSDGSTLGKFADTTLYLVRQRYTYKRQLQLVNEIYEDKKLPKLGLIVNDVLSEGARSYYGYGGGRYGYGYSYGYGFGGSGKKKENYFESKLSQSGLLNIFKQKK